MKIFIGIIVGIIALSVLIYIWHELKFRSTPVSKEEEDMYNDYYENSNQYLH